MRRLFRGALAPAFMMMSAAALAPAAHAALPAPVVQQREVGLVLLAHRYDSPDTTSQQNLTVVIKPNNDWATQTLLDFDRDGEPDVLVNIYSSTPGAATVAWQTWRLTKGTVSPGLGTGAPPCFTPIPGHNATNVGVTGARPVNIVKRANSWAVTITANFNQLFGDDNARYAPRMTTIFTNAARSMGSSNTVQDYLPNTAAPAVAPSETSCLGRPSGQSSYSSGVGVLPDRGTDRGQSTIAAIRRQTMYDRADQGVTVPDLVRADVEQWYAVRPADDVTADIPGSGVTVTHPSDLVLHFRDRAQLGSATYFFKGSSDAPSGLVVTDAVPPANAGDPVTQVEVRLHQALTGLNGNRCYPRTSDAAVGAGTWGPQYSALRLVLPITDDERGNPTVRIDLDPLLNIYTGGYGDTPLFRWVATTALGAAPPDYAPEVTKPPPPVPGACTYGSTDNGTVLYPGQAVQMNTSVPDATLTPTNASPDRGVPITLTAGGGSHFRFDATDSGTFGASTTTATVSQDYSVAKTARVYVTDDAGTANMAQARITPANPLPVAKIKAEPAGPFVLGSGIVPGKWTDVSEDSAGGTIVGHSWRLTSDRLAAPIEKPDDPVFSRTFNPGDQGTYTLTLTTTDNDGATATASTTFEVIQPPVAIIDKVTPCSGGGPDACATEPGPIVCDPDAGCQYRAWARTATDGSLGSHGPLHYFFDWGIRDTDGNSIFYDWSDLGYGDSFFPFAGAYPIRMKVLDADGRSSVSPYVTVRTRRANEHPPTARLTSTLATLAATGDAVLFDASGSVLNNVDGSTQPAQRFRFDFGDGSEPLETTTATASHIYTGSGKYRASVVAIDDRAVLSPPSESDPAELSLRVASGPGDVNIPLAVITRLSPAGKVYANRPVQLSAATSTIKDAPAHFTWDLDGDGTYETDTGDQATVTTRFPAAGHRDVKVHITDAEGREGVSAPLGLDLLPDPINPPTVVLEGPDTVTVSGGVATAALDASKSVAGNDEPALAFEWDLDGDGIYETNTGADPHARARFTLSGDQVVRVRATDVFGNTAIAARTIFVRGEAEVTAGCAGREQYRAITYKLVRVTGCFVSAPRPNAGPLWVAHGDVTLNGLRLQAGTRGHAPVIAFPDCTGACATLQHQFNDAGQGRRIALDLSDGHLVSNAPIAVKAAGSGVSLALNDGVLNETLPENKDDDGLMFHPPGGAKLLSLDLASTAEVTFPVTGQAVVAMTVHLPPQMPGVGGDVTLRATETQGLILDHLKIEVQTGVLSDYLKLGSLSVEYDRPDDQWTGHAELGLPGIKGKEFGLEVEIVIKAGKFKSIYGSIDGLEIALGEGIFLQRIRAGVGVDPLDLQGGLGISAGPKIAGTQLLSADGDLRVTFPSTTAPYTLFQVAGKTTLLDTLDLSRGVLRFATNGFFEGRYGITRDVGIAYFDADLGGWFTFDKANFTGNAEAGIRFLGDRIKLAGVHAVLSTKGIAACGEIPVIKLGGGVGYRWGDQFNVFTGCDLGPYSEARPEGIPDGFEVRAAAATAPAVTLPAGLRSAGITVSGRGGPPQVNVVDAKGHTVLDATKESLTPTAMVAFDPNTATTSILWKAPPKGKYLVIAAAGSPAIAKVRQAVDAGPQKVRVTVTGAAAKRSLRWTVTPKLQKGQELTLGEAVALDGAGHDITTTTKSSGTMAFTPQDGHGERRVVTATIITDGLGRPSTVAARFSAPRFVLPARPKGVTVTRRGRTVTVSWAPGATAAPAGGWRVGLSAGDLKAVTAVVAGKKRAFTVPGVPVGLPVSASVAGLAANRAPGTAAKATLAAGAARTGAATGAAAARPTGLKARRSGRKLVVSWKPGAERAKGYSVVVTIGKAAPVRLSTSARRPTVSVAGLPKGRTPVKVEVRAQRFAGGTSGVARLSGRR